MTIHVQYWRDWAMRSASKQVEDGAAYAQTVANNNGVLVRWTDDDGESWSYVPPNKMP